MSGISEELFVDLERGCDFQRDCAWSTRDEGERHFISKCCVNVPRLIAEIRRLRAENKELRASYERVEKYGQILLIEIRELKEHNESAPWDGPARWWKCECGESEKRPPNVHAAVCHKCLKQMQPAA